MAAARPNQNTISRLSRIKTLVHFIPFDHPDGYQNTISRLSRIKTLVSVWLNCAVYESEYHIQVK